MPAPAKAKPPALSAAQRKILREHSIDGLDQAVAELGASIKNQRWLRVSNVYGTSAAEKLDRDRKAHRGPKLDQLAQYIAASGPLHAADGWAFASRAIEAMLNGDPDAARHLAYYAELRGALSLLASQGIGVFNGPHAVITESGEARILKGVGTHVMTWNVLRYWMTLAESSEAVGSLVSQDGVDLATWVMNLPLGGAWRAVGKRWLTTWGIDLRDAVLDRGARNRASYTPTRLYNARAPRPVAARDFVVEWWTALEPAPAAPFEAIDRHLLRASLEQIFAAQTGHAPAAKQDRFRAAVSTAKEATTGDGSLDDSLGRFLTRELEPVTSPLLVRAASHSAADQPDQHLEVLARATLLLRLASGAAAAVLSRSNLTEASLRFWIEGVGEDRALWHSGDYPDELTDLWADIEVALEDVSAAETGDLESYKRLHDRFAPTLLVLSGAERVGLWGAVA